MVKFLQTTDFTNLVLFYWGVSLGNTRTELFIHHHRHSLPIPAKRQWPVVAFLFCSALVVVGREYKNKWIEYDTATMIDQPSQPASIRPRTTTWWRGNKRIILNSSPALIQWRCAKPWIISWSPQLLLQQGHIQRMTLNWRRPLLAVVVPCGSCDWNSFPCKFPEETKKTETTNKYVTLRVHYIPARQTPASQS